MSRNIAIDGPAGAGKSTIARMLAARLGYIYVDTGAMYRAMALYMLNHQVDAEDVQAVTSACEIIDIRIEYRDGVQCVYLNGELVNEAIRTEAVSQMASRISALPVVREKLLDLQRSLAASSDVIMDGRDIGTHVLPNADVKIFLTASSRVRALRRYKELTERNEACTLEAIEAEIIERDNRDMNRSIAPLKQAGDAHLVDTSEMTIEEVVERLYGYCQSI